MCVFCSMYAKNGAKRAAAYSYDEPVAAALAAGALVAIAGEAAAGVVRAEVADRRGGRDGVRLDVLQSLLRVVGLLRRLDRSVHLALLRLLYLLGMQHAERREVAFVHVDVEVECRSVVVCHPCLVA